MTATIETQAATTLPAPDLSTEALAAVTAQLAETAEHYDRTGEFPAAGVLAAHRAGLLTATVGEQFGGPQVSLVDAARILVALGEGDPAVALIAANNLGVHQAQALSPHWPTGLYEEFVRRSAERPTLANAVRAEPELGAPARGGIPATRITRDGDHWVLGGRKAYATGGVGLDYHVVWVATDDETIGHLVVDASSAGISWIETWDHLGQRATNTHDVEYRDVVVPLENFVEIPRGADGVYRDPAAATALGSFGHPALYIGVARAARSAFADYTRSRVPSALGKPISHTERIQTVAGEIDAQIAQAETLLYGALLRAEAGHTEHLDQLSLIKVQIARSVIAAVTTAVSALGNGALTRHQRFERHLRDVLNVRVHPPQEDSALLAAGRRLLTD